MCQCHNNDVSVISLIFTKNVWKFNLEIKIDVHTNSVFYDKNGNMLNLGETFDIYNTNATTWRELIYKVVEYVAANFYIYENDTFVPIKGFKFKVLTTNTEYNDRTHLCIYNAKSVGEIIDLSTIYNLKTTE